MFKIYYNLAVFLILISYNIFPSVFTIAHSDEDAGIPVVLPSQTGASSQPKADKKGFELTSEYEQGKKTLTLSSKQRDVSDRNIFKLTLISDNTPSLKILSDYFASLVMSDEEKKELTQLETTVNELDEKVNSPNPSATDLIKHTNAKKNLNKFIAKHSKPIPSSFQNKEINEKTTLTINTVVPLIFKATPQSEITFGSITKMIKFKLEGSDDLYDFAYNNTNNQVILLPHHNDEVTLDSASKTDCKKWEKTPIIDKNANYFCYSPDFLFGKLNFGNSSITLRTAGNKINFEINNVGNSAEKGLLNFNSASGTLSDNFKTATLDKMSLAISGKEIKVDKPTPVSLLFENNQLRITGTNNQPYQTQFKSDDGSMDGTLSFGSISLGKDNQEFTDGAIFVNSKTKSLSPLSGFEINPGFSTYAFKSLNQSNKKLEVDGFSFMNQNPLTVSVFKAKRLTQEEDMNRKVVSKIDQGELIRTSNTDNSPFLIFLLSNKTTDYLKIDFGIDKDASGKIKELVIHDSFSNFFDDLQSASAGPVLLLPYISKAFSITDGKIYVRKNSYSKRLLLEDDKKYEIEKLINARAGIPLSTQEISKMTGGYYNAFAAARVGISNAYITSTYDQASGYSAVEYEHANDGATAAALRSIIVGNAPEEDVANVLRLILGCFLPPGSMLLTINLPRILAAANDLFTKLPALNELSKNPDKLKDLPKLDHQMLGEQIMIYLASKMLSEKGGIEVKAADFDLSPKDIKAGNASRACKLVLNSLDKKQIAIVRKILIENLEPIVKYNVQNTYQDLLYIQLEMAEATETIVKSLALNKEITELKGNTSSLDDPRKVDRAIKTKETELLKSLRDIDEIKDRVYNRSKDMMDRARFRDWMSDEIIKIGKIDITELNKREPDTEFFLEALEDKKNVKIDLEGVSNRILATRLLERTLKDSSSKELLDKTNAVQFNLEAKELVVQIIQLHNKYTDLLSTNLKKIDLNTLSNRINSLLVGLESYLNSHKEVITDIQHWLAKFDSANMPKGIVQIVSRTHSTIKVHQTKRRRGDDEDTTTTETAVSFERLSPPPDIDEKAKTTDVTEKKKKQIEIEELRRKRRGNDY